MFCTAQFCRINTVVALELFAKVTDITDADFFGNSTKWQA
jgi:hypothetical protein